ncbi:sigma-54-dependent transcriptional regulator [Paludibaculum fermentans]|uniref:sigma-54-dependent transcriptional regulator n=1 Tax=Paludibaculum fermentans TaxID=1473598 RepID=UPI003EC0B411
MNPILVVDDDPGFRKLLETILVGEGYPVETAAKVAEARRMCAAKPYSLVVSDLKLPDGDGLDVQKWFAEHAPKTPFVLITGFGTVSTAVDAMKRGALDYLEKPLRSPDELRRIVRRAMALNAGSESVLEEVEPAAGEPAGLCGAMVARDQHMLHILGLLQKVAPTPATVLLLGESGVGKEVIARCLHANSRRAAKPFVAVNCAALAPSLIESELFGHERGSFTGATDRHSGVFERADGGTLFLDEIGELDAALQAKLLRVLQERVFERVGGGKAVEVDVRVVAATNQDLSRAVQGGRFRADLYFRLSTFPIEIPPLRQRPADIDALAELFLGRAARRFEKPDLRLSDEARYALRAHAWPGNVRELENAMERAAILADATVMPEHLPFAGASTTLTQGAGPLNMRDLERRAIDEALQRHDGNRTHAARELGISLRTLQYRLKEYGLG